MNIIRVLVVDDSAFSRRTITTMLEELEGVEVVGYAIDGEDGIKKVMALKPDLVTLDLEMPKMDGFSLLRILTARFSIPVIIISALSSADKVFKALELGALDFVAKPSMFATPELFAIREDLRLKVRQVLNLKNKPKKDGILLESKAKPLKPQSNSSNIKHQFDVVAIGASTGGPSALHQIISAFECQFPFAVVVSQHMPPGFTKAFAERLDRSSPFDVIEAADGDAVLPGRILVAPGGSNMVFERQSGQVFARIVPPDTSDRYIPSVDAMLISCAEVFERRIMAVILTGMGNDGSKGVRAVKQQGGYVISESEETAVVFGMPREAAATGLVDSVLPLHMITQAIISKGGYKKG